MKLCGRDEPCFERGECWGHMEGVMCKHLGEKLNGFTSQSYCMKHKEFVDDYTTLNEKQNMLNKKGNNNGQENH